MTLSILQGADSRTLSGRGRVVLGKRLPKAARSIGSWQDEMRRLCEGGLRHGARGTVDVGGWWWMMVDVGEGDGDQGRLCLTIDRASTAAISGAK